MVHTTNIYTQDKVFQTAEEYMQFVKQMYQEYFVKEMSDASGTKSQKGKDKLIDRIICKPLEQHEYAYMQWILA